MRAKLYIVLKKKLHVDWRPLAWLVFSCAFHLPFFSFQFYPLRYDEHLILYDQHEDPEEDDVADRVEDQPVGEEVGGIDLPLPGNLLQL